MRNIEGLKFSILDCGRIETDASIIYNMHNSGTADDPNPPQEWKPLSVISILIKHPEAGYILYDGSCRHGDEWGGGRRRERDAKVAPYFADEDQWIEQQLQKVGITIDDLSMVIISHMHWDHSGILEQLSHTKAGENVYVSKHDFGYGLVETHQEKEGYILCVYL